MVICRQIHPRLLYRHVCPNIFKGIQEILIIPRPNHSDFQRLQSIKKFGTVLNISKHTMRKLIRGNLEVQERIGKGRYGTVYRVISRQWGCEFCLKVISNTESDPITRYLFNQEAQTLRLVGHNNVVRLYDYFEEDGIFMLLLEYCPNGSLQNMIDREGPFPIQTLRTVFRQLFEATKFFHGINVCHRDIKPANIASDRLWRPKLLEWGYSTVVKDGELLNTFCGSLPYTPPECVSRIPYDGRKADMWSLGVTLFVCAFARDPWTERGKNEDMKPAILAARIRFDDNTNPELKDLISRLLRVNPDERLSAEEALTHPFFNTCALAKGSGSEIGFRVPVAKSVCMKRRAMTAKRLLCMSVG